MKTGKTKHIDISLWDCAIAALVNQAHNVLASGKTLTMGSAHPNLVPYRAFKAMMVGLLLSWLDNQWQNSWGVKH